MFDDDTIKFFTEAKRTRCRTCKVVKLHVFHNYSKRSCQYIESYFFIHPHQRHRFQLYSTASSFSLYASNTPSPSRSKRLGPAPPNLRRGHRHLVAAQSSKPLTPAAHSGGSRSRHCQRGHAAPVCAKARTGAIGWRPHSTGSPSGPASQLPRASP